MMKKVKKSKKAFTLTELIAVIVIIGILSTFIIIGVSKYINGARDNTYNSYIKTMEKAAENMMVECASGKGDCYDEIPNQGEMNTINYEELVTKGYAEKLKDPEKDGSFCDGSVEVSNVNGNGVVSNLSYEGCLKCSNTPDKYKCEENEKTKYALCSDGDDQATCCSKFNSSLSNDSKININNWTNTDRVIRFGCSSGNNCKYQKRFSINTNEKIEKGEVELLAGDVTYSCPVNIYIDKSAPKCSIVTSTSTPSNGWYTEQVTMELNTDFEENDGKNIKAYGISNSSKKVYNNKTSIQTENGITTIFGYVKDSLGNEGSCYREVKVNSNGSSGIKQSVALGYQIYPEEKNSVEDIEYGIKVGNLRKYEIVRGMVIYFKEEIVNSTANIGYKLGEDVTNLGYNVNGKEMVSILSSAQKVDSISIQSSGLKDKIDKIYLIVDNYDLDIYTNKDMLLYNFASEDIEGVKDYSFDNSEFSVKPYTLVTENKNNISVKARTVHNIQNEVKINITKIDKVAPSIPTVAFYKWKNNDADEGPKISERDSLDTYEYNADSWSDKKLAAEAKGSVDSLSGIDGSYKYKTMGADNREKTVSPGGFLYITNNGTTTLKYTVCDRAGNCSNTRNYTLNIDTKDGPDVTIAGYRRNSSGTRDANAEPIKIGGYNKGESYSSAVYKADIFTNKNIVTDWYPYDLTFEVYMKPFNPIVKVETRVSDDGYSTYGDANSSLTTKSWTTVNLNENQKTGKAPQYYGILGNGSRIRQIRITNQMGKVKTINITGNVDNTIPDIEIRIYKADSNGNKTGSALKVLNSSPGFETSTSADVFKNKNVRISRNIKIGQDTLRTNWFNYPVVFEVKGISSYSDIKKIEIKTGTDSNSYENSRKNVVSNYTIDREYSSKTITRPYTLGKSGNGVLTRHVRVINAAGTSSKEIIIEGAVDKVEPKCAITKTSTGSSGVGVKVECKDIHSHCYTGTQTDTLKSNKTYTINDKAGNSNTCTVKVSSSNCSCYTTGGYCDSWYTNSYHVTSCGTAQNCTTTCPSGYTVTNYSASLPWLEGKSGPGYASFDCVASFCDSLAPEEEVCDTCYK